MRELQNVNLTKLIGEHNPGHDFFYSHELRKLVHVTHIPFNDVNVFEYDCNNKDDVKSLLPNSFLTYFFVNVNEDGRRVLLKIKRGKDDVGQIGKRMSWKRLLEESTYVYVVGTYTLQNVYKNGRVDTFHMQKSKRHNALAERLKSFKIDKLMKHDNVLDYVMNKVSNLYFEMSKNFLNPSDEFVNKMPKRYIYHRCVDEFLSTTTSVVNDVKSILDYNKRYNINNEKSEDYKERLLHLYGLVKNF